MSSRIDRIHEQALESLRAEWTGVLDLAEGHAEGVSVSARRAVSEAVGQWQGGDAVGDVPERYRSWFRQFSDRFRRAEGDLLMLDEVDDPPEEQSSEWAEAVQQAEGGKGVPLLALILARGLRQKRR